MNKETILGLLLVFMSIMLLSSLEFNLMNAFENATYEGREIMYRQAIARYNPQDGILNLPPSERYSKMKNIDKIQQMTADDWFNQVLKDGHLIPTLCFMCVGCDVCEENCVFGIKQWLKKESEE